jgi:hypothetical protein
MQGGQIVVVFYDQMEPITRLLAEFGATPVSTIDAASMVGARQAADAFSSVGA